jgi:hypothetical protein
MITNRLVTRTHPSGGSEAGPGERLRRLRQRRRLLREEILAISVLLVALAITVAVLATQWLGENTTGSQSLPSIQSTISVSGGTT